MLLEAIQYNQYIEDKQSRFIICAPGAVFDKLLKTICRGFQGSGQVFLG